MMKVDVAISDTEKSHGEKGVLDCSSTRSVVGADEDANTDADTGNRSLLLDFLPRDLLTQSILTSFLDGNSLSSFWCATMSKREMIVRRSSSLSSPRSSSPSSPPSMAEEILQMIQRRRAWLTEEEDNFEDTQDNQRYCLRRQVFQLFEEAISSQSALDGMDTNNSSLSKNSDETDETGIDTDSHNELQKNNGPFFNFKEFLRFSRRVFGNLLAMDYCERVPHNLIWCGYLRIQHSQLGAMNATEPIKVALVVHPRRWSMKEIRLWRNATEWSLSSSSADSARQSEVIEKERRKPPTIKANVIPHNFLPVGPTRGRLVGLTDSARISLRQISDGLNHSEQVGRFSCATVSAPTATSSSSSSSDGPVSTMSVSDSNTDRNHGRQFTVKLVSFAQAERKLGTVFRRGYEPGGIPLGEEKESMTLQSIGSSSIINNDSIAQSNINHDRNSLLCCWSHEFLWEDSSSFRMETSYALRDLMNEYDRLVQ